MASGAKNKAGLFTGLLERGTVDLANPATCAGCGCTDREGCFEGCTWLAVNRRNRTGVCSSCPDQLEAWKAQQ